MPVALAALVSSRFGSCSVSAVIHGNYERSCEEATSRHVQHSCTCMQGLRSSGVPVSGRYTRTGVKPSPGTFPAEKWTSQFGRETVASSFLLRWRDGSDHLDVRLPLLGFADSLNYRPLSLLKVS